MLSDEIARRANGVFLARLVEQVDALASQPFPGLLPGPNKWLAIVRGLIDTGFDYLDQSILTSDNVLANQLIVDAAELGQLAVCCINLFKGAEAAEIPYQVVRPLQRWFDELQITNTLFFRAEHAPNYELARFPKDPFSIRNPSKSLREALKNINWPIHRVTVPSRSLGILTHFAVVAHEAGHAIFHHVAPSLQSKLPSQLFDEITVKISTELAHSLSTEQSSFIIDVRNKWIEELTADIIGLSMVGPAFYFALFGFLEMASPGYGISDTHPPSYLRRKLLYGMMSVSNGFTSVFERVAKLKFVENLNSPGLKVASTDAVLRNDLRYAGFKDFDIITMLGLVDYLEKIYNIIYSETVNVMKTSFSSVVYTPDNYEEDLKTHLDPLCIMIPPIEYEKNNIKLPTSLSTILNVGWVAQLARVDEIKVPSSKSGTSDVWRMERIHSLLLKAVELSEARHTWDSVK